MKILLINPPNINTIVSCMPKILEEDLDFFPPLGLMYLAGYLRKYNSHQIKILDCQLEQLNYKQLKQKLIQENPDVVGITTMTFTLIDVIKTAQLIKQINHKIKVVLGGPHVNIYPQETMNIKEIDFLVLGEGEESFKKLLDNINQTKKLHQIKGIVFKDKDKIINTGNQKLVENLDLIPFPARDLLPYQKYFSVISSKKPITTMFTSRGCPFKCLFCDRPHLGKLFRARSAKNVVDEMEECQKLGIKEIFIYDDTFTVNRQRVLDICSEIKKRNLTISWDVRTRVDTVDQEIIKVMKDANCQRIHFGVEAGTQKILDVLRKGINLKQIEKAFKITKKNNIQTVGYFMIGSPNETKKDILETIKLAKKLNPDFVHISITTPFPATDLYYLGLKKNILPYDYWQRFAKNPDPNFTPLPWEENLSKEKLLKLLKYGYQSFYFRPSYILKRLFKLKSLQELKDKTKASFRLLRI
ncbi:MAG: cobalamin-dependent protein [Nanoarchaeota archaeon]|nr:cobalamin-dependent protein [Nanoarchaeota archaeon]